MQLDIVEHSRDAMLCNDALQALQQRASVAAHTAWRSRLNTRTILATNMRGR